MKFAVYSHEWGWLVDTCAGGLWAWDGSKCVEFDSVEDAKLALQAAEIDIDPADLVFPRVR